MQSAEEAFPSKSWFLEFNSTDIYNGSTLKCDIFTLFYTGVCFISQSSRGKVYLWGNSSKLGPLFKKPKHDRKYFVNPGGFWSSCTVMQTISRLQCRQRRAGTQPALPSPWSLGWELGLFDWVPQPCYSSSVPNLGPKRHQFILCKANWNTPFQHISDGLTAVGPHCTGASVIGLAFWQPKHTNE